MRHRTRDTYPLSHFRQHTRDHLERLAEGKVETITQNGEAAMVVMSPDTYDLLTIALERGHLWADAIARYDAGERGIPADEAIQQVARELGLKL
jgi:prevent-host-death family protein